jgi:hypothetical protein
MCTVETCDKRHHANGYCSTHNHRWLNHGDPLYVPHVVSSDNRLEDARWLAETGEGLTNAAERLGVNVKALEKFLRRYDRACLARLIAAEPKDHNRYAFGEGVSVAELTGQTSRRRRRRAAA